MIRRLFQTTTNKISFRNSTRSFALSFKGDKVEEDVLQKIRVKDNEIRKHYESIDPPMNSSEYDSARRRRMIYRSKQRGWLEADILMGSWATLYVPTLSNEEMDEYEEILKEETIDVFNFISGKDPLPDHLKNSKIMKRLMDYANNSGVTNPEAYEEIKRKTNLT